MKKFNPKFVFKPVFLPVFFLIIVSIVCFLLEAPSYKKYTAICSTLLKEELSMDSLSLHFTLSNPEKYHISSSQVVLPSLKKEDRVQQNARLEEHLDSLSRLKTKTWTLPQQISHEILLSSMKGSLTGEEFVYFYEPFSSSHGIQSEYPMLLFEYAFRREEDIKQYLKLLELTPDYFESMVEFEKERLAQGYIFSESNATSAIDACDNFASARDAFLTTFQKRMDPLIGQNVISPETAKSYESCNERIVDTIVLPAFTKLGDEILLLKQHGVEEKSLYHKSGGKEYYSYLLQESVGTDKNVSELKTLLLQNLKNNLEEFQQLLTTKEFDAISRIQDPLTKMSPGEMMEDIKMRMKNDFELNESNSYPYEIQTVDSCLEPYTAPAYYFTPPLDALDENHIYINEQQTADGVHLYTTLAHEGFPGHLYQAVTSQNAFINNQLPLLRGVLGYGGFVEGYATYAELSSYEYAKECAKNLGTNADSLFDVYYYDRQIKLCLYSLLDIMIHGEGKNLGEVTAFLSDFGIQDDSAANAIYQYILNEPTTYLKYYVGYLEILECKQLAIENWGSDYSHKNFHKYLLEIGPAPFSIIKKAIRQYGG